MASINHAKSYMAYVVAILISATFALIGRSAPTWAEDIKIDRNAKVFEEVFRVAQGGTGVNNVNGRTQVTNPNLEGRTQVTNPAAISGRHVGFSGRHVGFSGRNTVWANRLQVPSPVQFSLNVVDQLNSIYTSTMNEIYNKLQNNPQDITTEELALIRANANAIEIENLKNSDNGSGGNVQ